MSYKANQELLGCTVFDPTVLLRPEKIHCYPTTRIDAFCKIEGGEGVYLGEHVHIASFCHLNIGGGLTIFHEGSSAGSGCRVISGSNVHGHGRSCSAVAPGAEFKRQSVIIGKNATLFAGAIVLPGVKIGENAVIAAGSVVRCNVPAFEIWAGVPARKVGDLKPLGATAKPEPAPSPHDQGAVMRNYLAGIDELSR